METDSTHSVLTRVQEIISTELGIVASEIEPTTVLVSLVTDSLEMLNLFMELEGQFNLTIEDDELQKILTVGDVVKYVEAHQ